MRDGPSEAFRLFHRAILEQKQVVCFYKGRRRDLCPHILGHKEGRETALVFQFGGESRGGLPPRGEWRCLHLAGASKIELRDGPWHSGAQHRRRQQCVDRVFVDVNTSVPNQPGRP